MDIRQTNASSQKYSNQKVQNQKHIQEVKRLRKQINHAQKRRVAERILFALIIFALLFLFLDTRLQLKRTRSYAASLEQAVQDADLSYNLSDTSNLSDAGNLSDTNNLSVVGKGSGEKDSSYGKNDFSEAENSYEANLARWELETVEKPRKRSEAEVLQKLKELSRENELIAAVMKQPDRYPPRLLEALANNPEMAEFVKGYLYADSETKGQFTDSEKEADFPLFLQWDPRWGYAYYGDDSNIAVSGCGPTSLSMALFYLTGDDSLTPDYLAAYSMQNGYYVSGTGTAWALITDVPPMYGVSVTEPDADEALMKRELDRGNILIASVGPGDFTAGGHLLVIYDYDRNGFKINDPNCIARSRQSWDFEALKPQLKHLWSLGD